MARSTRRTPILSNTGAPSDKIFKRRAARRLRLAVRAGLRSGREILPVAREIASTWDFPKDGKHWFGHLSDAELAPMMRK